MGVSGSGAYPSFLRSSMFWHLLLIGAVSIWFESLFIHSGLSVMDEGWPVYAAMRLHQGDALYREVFWVFPPGHLLPAWIAAAIDPPGIITTRMIYAAFTVALCLSLYSLGRRFMPERYALFGSLLLAVAAPVTHYDHQVFGYRYLVFSVITLLFFDQRLRTRKHIWMLPAGIFAGIALFFRLTPALAVSVAIAIAAIAVNTDWRHWFRDWCTYAVGVLLVLIPTLLWFGQTVGLETLWSEVVVRPVEMTRLQALPMPGFNFPSWSRWQIASLFTSVQFRLYIVFYLGFAAWLGAGWLRALREKRDFEHPLLLATVIWGGVFFSRSFGRSDEPHLYSALPPICLLWAYLGYALLGWGRLRLSLPGKHRRWVPLILACAFLGIWIFLMGSELFFSRAFRGTMPLHSVEEGATAVAELSVWRMFESKVEAIRSWTDPGDTILNLTPSPLLHVLSERMGPGYQDLIMPGTFANRAEELAFLERLKQSPPALVIWPVIPFDRRPSRSIQVTAPKVSNWVRANYERRGNEIEYILMVPRKDASPR